MEYQVIIKTVRRFLLWQTIKKKQKRVHVLFVTSTKRELSSNVEKKGQRGTRVLSFTTTTTQFIFSFVKNKERWRVWHQLKHQIKFIWTLQLEKLTNFPMLLPGAGNIRKVARDSYQSFRCKGSIKINVSFDALTPL